MIFTIPLHFLALIYATNAVPALVNEPQRPVKLVQTANTTTTYYSNNPDMLDRVLSGNAAYPKNTCYPKNYAPGSVIDRYYFPEGYLAGVELEYESCLDQGVGLFGSVSYRSDSTSGVIIDFENQRIIFGLKFAETPTPHQISLCLFNGQVGVGGPMNNYCVFFRFIKVDLPSQLPRLDSSYVPKLSVDAKSLFTTIGADEIVKEFRFGLTTQIGSSFPLTTNAVDPKDLPRNTCHFRDYVPGKVYDHYYFDYSLPTVVISLENCMDQGIGFRVFAKIPTITKMLMTPLDPRGITFVLDFSEGIRTQYEIKFLLVNGVFGDSGSEEEMEASAVTIRFHKIHTEGQAQKVFTLS